MDNLGTASIRVLFIDDGNQAAQRLIDSLSVDPRFHIYRARTFAEAVRGLEANRQFAEIAAVSLDLPDNPGLSTIKRLQHISPLLPIVALVADDEQGLDAIGAGADDYLCCRAPEVDAWKRTLRAAVVRNRKGLRSLPIARNAPAGDRFGRLSAFTRAAIADGKDLYSAFGAITEAVAKEMNVERAAIWRFNHERTAMVCHDLYSLSVDRHSAGAELAVRDYPKYFAALDANEALAAADAQADQRTAEFAESYLVALGIRSMLDAPIFLNGRLDGVLCIEQVGPNREWSAGEQSFATAMANLVSLLIVEDRRSRSESRLAAIVQSEPECVIVVSSDGLILDVNPAGLRMLEIDDVSDVLNRPVARFIVPEDRESYMQLHHQVGQGETARLQFRLVGRNGTVRWMETHSTPLPEDSRSSSVLSVMRDVTRQKHAQEAILQAAKAVSTAIDDQFFDRLTQSAAEALDATGAAIAVLQEHGESTVCTQTFLLRGEKLKSVCYDVRGTPCESVVEGRPCVATENICEAFPDDPMLSELGLEAYIGVPLQAKSGEVLGLLAAFFDHPIDDVEFKLSTLQIFASRIAAELERQEMRDAIESMHRRHSLILDSVGDGILGVDNHGRINFANRAAAELLGRDQKELLNADFSEILSGGHLDYVKRTEGDLAISENSQIQNGPRFFETTLSRRGGEPFPASCVSSPVWHSGESTGAIVSFTDASERKTIERLRDVENRVMELISTGAELQTVLDAIAAGVERVSPAMTVSILLIDDDGRFRYGSAPSLPDDYKRQIDGVKIGPMAGSCGAAVSLVETFVTEDIATDPRWDGFQEAAAMYGLHACWSKPILDPEGNPSAAFGIYRKAPGRPTEDELELIERFAKVVGIAIEREHRERQLKESRERFQLLSQATNDIVFEWNLVTDEVRFNNCVAAKLGYSAVEMGPSLEAWMQRIHPDDRKATIDSIQTAIQQRRDHWAGEYRFQRKDGNYAIIYDRGYFISDESGVPVRMIGGMTDVTKQRNLELQLLHSQKMEAVGKLAGGIAHDFNNLLVIINGYSELLLEGLPAIEPRRSMLEDIRAAGQRARDLTQQLLAFSRKQMLVPKVLNLNEVVTNVESMLRRLIGENIRLESDLDPGIGLVKVDLGQLEQVLVNLAVNARDAMPNGGNLSVSTRNVRIETETESELTPRLPPGSYVAIEVSDTGCGMSPEIQTRIFEPFFTTKEVGQGTGLGLSTVFGIIQQSKGAIEVESAPGEGAHFRIFLPTVSPIETPRPRKREPQGESSGTVLLVEDDESVRQVALLILRSKGYNVIEAENGFQAIELAKANQAGIDLLLTDVVMPEMNGRELADSILAIIPEIKVVYMSGYTEDDIVLRGVGNSDQAFLQKPFSPSSLAVKVSDALASRSS